MMQLVVSSSPPKNDYQYKRTMLIGLGSNIPSAVRWLFAPTSPSAGLNIYGGIHRNENEANNGVQRTSHKVRRPLPPDVRHKGELL